MNPLEPPDYAENTERVAWIRRLCKGKGLPRMLKGVPYVLFDVPDWDELVEALYAETLYLPSSWARSAIRNALNVQGITDLGSRSGLVERRALLASEWGITPRTLDRFEYEGARLLDHAFQKRLQPTALMDAVHELHDAVRSVGRVSRRYPLPDGEIERVEQAVRELSRSAAALTDERMKLRTLAARSEDDG